MLVQLMIDHHLELVFIVLVNLLQPFSFFSRLVNFFDHFILFLLKTFHSGLNEICLYFSVDLDTLSIVKCAYLAHFLKLKRRNIRWTELWGHSKRGS